MQGESNVKLIRKVPSDRSFGFALAFVLGLLSLIQLYKEAYTLGFYFSSGAILLLIIALVYAQALNPINRLWFWVSGLLGAIVSPVIMGILYFVIIVPVGLIMKLKTEKKEQPGNWKNITRDIDKQSLTRQF